MRPARLVFQYKGNTALKNFLNDYRHTMGNFSTPGFSNGIATVGCNTIN